MSVEITCGKCGEKIVTMKMLKSLKDVLNIIKDSGSNIHLHLINSSSGINFAWEKEPKLSYGEAAAKALEALVNEQAAC